MIILSTWLDWRMKGGKIKVVCGNSSIKRTRFQGGGYRQ